MSVNSDSVMRSVFFKYLHPKEVYISEGILVPDLIRKKVGCKGVNSIAYLTCNFLFILYNHSLIYTYDATQPIQ